MDTAPCSQCEQVPSECYVMLPWWRFRASCNDDIFQAEFGRVPQAYAEFALLEQEADDMASDSDFTVSSLSDYTDSDTTEELEEDPGELLLSS